MSAVDETPDLEAAGRLESLAGLVTAFAVVFALAAVGAGVAIVFTSSTSLTADGATSTSHPYVVVGVGVAVVGIFGAAVVAMFAAWARTYALSVQFGADVSLDDDAQP